MTEITKVDLTQNPIAYQPMDPIKEGQCKGETQYIVIKDNDGCTLVGKIVTACSVVGFFTGAAAVLIGWGVSSEGAGNESATEMNIGNAIATGGGITVGISIISGIVGCILGCQDKKEKKENATNRLDP